MQDNINSIILSFINKAQEENNSNNDGASNENAVSSSNSPKNSATPTTNGLPLLGQIGQQASTEGSNSPNRGDNQSPSQDQPISGISLLSHPSMKRPAETINDYNNQINPIDMDAQERKKQERKRERNRIAAAKCRERKMTKINTLENEVKQMQTQIKNYTIERDYYKNRCTRIVEMVNEYIKKGDKQVPIAEIQHIIETITDEERERMHGGEPDEPSSKHNKYGM